MGERAEYDVVIQKIEVALRSVRLARGAQSIGSRRRDHDRSAALTLREAAALLDPVWPAFPKRRMQESPRP